jgi:hypothetical protein
MGRVVVNPLFFEILEVIYIKLDTLQTKLWRYPMIYHVKSQFEILCTLSYTKMKKKSGSKFEQCIQIEMLQLDKLIYSSQFF